MAEAIAFDQANADLIINRLAGTPGAMLPILHALQDEFGCVPEQAVPMVAHALNLSRAEVHGVVTFYHDYHRQPRGAHVLKLCQAEACQSNGCRALAAEVQDRLGIALGETTPDGRVTLEAVYCLGLCAVGPSAMLDGRVLGRMTGDKASRLLGALA